MGAGKLLRLAFSNSTKSYFALFSDNKNSNFHQKINFQAFDEWLNSEYSGNKESNLFQRVVIVTLVDVCV